MLKQVTMPVTIKTNQPEAMFIANGHPASVARHNERMSKLQLAIQDAEWELDNLLNSGFEIIAQYDAETQNVTSVTFVLHHVDIQQEQPEASDNYRDIEPEYIGDGFTEEYEPCSTSSNLTSH